MKKWIRSQVSKEIQKRKNNYYFIVPPHKRHLFEKSSYPLGKDSNQAIETYESFYINEPNINSIEYAFNYGKSLTWFTNKTQGEQKQTILNFKRLANEKYGNTKFRNLDLKTFHLTDCERFYNQLTNNATEKKTTIGKCFKTMKSLLDRLGNDQNFAFLGKRNCFDFRRGKADIEPENATLEQTLIFYEESKKIGRDLIGFGSIMAFFFKLREPDILKLKWSYFVNDQYLLLPNTKSHKGKIEKFYLYDEKGNHLFREYQTIKDLIPKKFYAQEYVMTWEKLYRGERKRYTLETFSRIANKIIKKCNFHNDIKFNSFRRGGIQYLADLGATHSQIQAHTRHKHSSTLDHYINRSTAQQIEGSKLIRKK